MRGAKATGESHNTPSKRARERNATTAKSVEVIAKIVGAGSACIPKGTYSGSRVVFERSKKLPGLQGHAACVGKTVSLSLHNLSLDAAAAVLVTLVFMRKEGKR
jgi:hypothetical protein